MKDFRELQSSSPTKKMMENSPDTILLYFDITSYASLDTLGRFLHNLYVHGLLFDEESGQVAALSSSLQYYVYIELPAISLLGETEDQEDFIWPIESSNRNVRSHPFLPKLPVLTLAVRGENYIFLDMDIPYFLTHQARLVASFWSLFCSNQLDTIPDFPQSPLETLSEGDFAVHLSHLFQTYHLNASKREQTNVIRLLSERVEYLAKLHAATQQETTTVVNSEEENFHISINLEADSVESFNYLSKSHWTLDQMVHQLEYLRVRRHL